jgi:uncharacterized protein (TIGR02001 family)
MNRFLLLFAALIATPAMAQTSGTLSVGTDYVSRGTSQTFGKPAAVLYVEHQFHDGTYVAGVLANVDFDDAAVESAYGDDGTFLETDAFVGHRGKLARNLTYDAGLAFIVYQGTKPTPGYNPSGNWNMVEAKLAVTDTIGRVALTGTVGVTPDYFNNYGPSVWTEARMAYTATPKLTINAAIGRQSFFQPSETDFPAELSNYITWSVGASYALTPTLSADLTYYDNDTKVDLGPIYKPRVVFSLRKAL